MVHRLSCTPLAPTTHPVWVPTSLLWVLHSQSSPKCDWSCKRYQQDRCSWVFNSCPNPFPGLVLARLCSFWFFSSRFSLQRPEVSCAGTHKPCPPHSAVLTSFRRLTFHCASGNRWFVAAGAQFVGVSLSLHSQTAFDLTILGSLHFSLHCRAMARIPAVSCLPTENRKGNSC